MTFRSSILASVRPPETTRRSFKNISGCEDDRSSLTKLCHEDSRGRFRQPVIWVIYYCGHDASGSRSRRQSRQARTAFAQALEALAGVGRVTAVSRLWRTRPIGPSQPDFLNAAALLDWPAGPSLCSIAAASSRRLPAATGRGKNPGGPGPSTSTSSSRHRLCAVVPSWSSPTRGCMNGVLRSNRPPRSPRIGSIPFSGGQSKISLLRPGTGARCHP